MERLRSLHGSSGFRNVLVALELFQRLPVWQKERKAGKSIQRLPLSW